MSKCDGVGKPSNFFIGLANLLKLRLTSKVRAMLSRQRSDSHVYENSYRFQGNEFESIQTADLLQMETHPRSG